MVAEIAFRYVKSAKQILKLMDNTEKKPENSSKVIQSEQLNLFYPTA
jgi:hypothetical protein